MTASPKPRGGVAVPPPAYLGRRFGAKSFLFFPLVLLFSLMAIVYLQIENPTSAGNFITTDSTDGASLAVPAVGTSGPHRALGSHSQRATTRRQAIGGGEGAVGDEVSRRVGGKQKMKFSQQSMEMLFTESEVPCAIAR